MEFDCKSQHHRCKAKCCGVIDFSTGFWEKNKSRVITIPSDIFTLPDGSRLRPNTESGYCCFLKEDYTCNVYEDRPEICKTYGDESTPHMCCEFLKKNGEPRSRQHRKHLQKMIERDYAELSKMTKLSEFHSLRLKQKFEVFTKFH